MLKALDVRSLIRKIAILVAAVVAGNATYALAQPTEAFRTHLLNRATFPTPSAHDRATGQLFIGVAGDVRTTRSLDAEPSAGTGRLYAAGKNAVLRLRVDAQRRRLWILDAGSVRVFDLVKNRLLTTLPLSNWLYADDGTNCLPDLQLDATGGAYVSDNVQPKLWRIDGKTFDILERTVSLNPRIAADVGFSALFIGENGVMLAAMGAPGLLWRVDTDLARAEQIPLASPIHGACDIQAQAPVRATVFTLFVLQAAAGRFEVKRVDLAPGVSTAMVTQVPLGSTEKKTARTGRLQFGSYAY